MSHGCVKVSLSEGNSTKADATHAVKRIATLICGKDKWDTLLCGSVIERSLYSRYLYPRCDSGIRMYTLTLLPVSNASSVRLIFHKYFVLLHGNDHDLTICVYIARFEQDRVSRNPG